MKITKTLATAMVIIMLMPLLMSCSSPFKRQSTVVKADDPWYESTMFKIDKQIRANETLEDTCLCASDEKIFAVYTLSSGQWSSSRTVIDTYDLYGNRMSRKDISCPEDKNILRIYSIRSDPKGTAIDAAVVYLGVGDDGPMFTSIDPETGKMTNVKSLYSKKAKRIIRKDASISDVSFIGEYTVVKMMCTSPSTRDMDWQLILYKNNEFVAELDLSSLDIITFMSGFTIDYSTDTLYAAGYSSAAIVTMEFDIKNGKLKDAKEYGETESGKINFAEYGATDTGDMCKIDSLGNIVMIDMDEMTPKTIVDTNWYNPFFHPAMSSNTLYSSTILSCSEERTVLLETESILYTSDYAVNTNYIRVLNKADKNPNAGKKVIKLALPPNSGVSDYIARSIYEFNRTNTEYLIRMWDKYKSGYNLYRYSESPDAEKQIYTMIQDLKGGDAPDLVIGIQKKYAMRDDIFMDLTGMLDPEVMEKQYKNVFEAAKVGGKQFFLPVTLEIEGLVTNKELLKEGAVGITFEEYDKIIKEKMDGFSPYDYPGSFEFNKRSFVLSCIDTKSTIEGEKIDFGTDQFRAAVKYAKDNIIYDDILSFPPDYDISDFNRYRGECYYTKIKDYLDYVHSCFKGKGQYNIIGTPSVNAAGPRFKASETISVSASTSEKDGCKKFLNYLFSGSAYSSENPSFRLIVTNREIMDKNTDATGSINNKAFEAYTKQVESGVFIPAVGLDKATGDKMATGEMKEVFLKCLGDLAIYYYEDSEITKFVFEELEPYFKGDHTLDEAITVLNDRTTKYVREL